MARNDYSVWSKPNTPEPPKDGHGVRSAAHRLTAGEYCFISHTPKFRFAQDDSFFPIGSCFAIHISKSLTEQGCDVLTDRLVVEKENFTDPQYDNEIALIKFTPHSMLNEIETNVCDRELPDHGLIALGDGRYWNPQLHKIVPTTLEKHLDIRERVKRTVSSIVEADVVFVTLGLTETWFDVKLNIALNENPLIIRELRRKPFEERFEFKNLDFEESLAALEEMLSVIKSKSRKDVKFILTVSPVPLQRTFTGDDVITANAYSKSVLRAVAQTLTNKYDWVDYFPSYEMVTSTPRDLAWRHNQRHVPVEMVDYVVRRFLDTYLT